MTTLEHKTLSVTVEAPFEQVANDLADPATHPTWGREFFQGEARPGQGDEVLIDSPVMGGTARFRVEAQPELGIIDLYIAPEAAPFGRPLPVRLLRNGSGVDVLWTLHRFPGTSDAQWEAGIASMARELVGLKQRHEK